MSEHNEEMNFSPEHEIQQLRFEQQVKEEAEKLGLVKSVEVKSEEIKNQEDSEQIQETAKEYSPEEKEAMEMGWNPDHTGENFVSAKEFIRVGQIIKAKREANKEAKELKEKLEENNKIVRQLLEHNKKVEELAYKKAKAELEARKREAIRTGDVDEFERIELEASTLQKPVEVQQPQSAQYTQDQIDFANRNRDWFNPQNPDLVNAVSKTYDFLKSEDLKSGVNRSESDLLAEVESTVKAIPRFSHKFQKTGVTKAKEAKVSLVETPSKSVSSQSISLSYEDKMMLKQIQMADPSFTEADLRKMKDQLKVNK